MPRAAQILGPVHGGVRVPQELLRTRVCGRPGGDADGGRGEHLRAVQVVGSGERFLHPLGDALRLLRVREVSEQQDELVAAQPRHRVARARHVAEAAGDLDQQDVALCVPKALVHGLEAVHVEEEHGEAVVRPPPLERQRLPEPIHEQRPVRQASEAVVERVVDQLLLGHLARRDVRLRARQPVRLARGVSDRRAAHQHPAPAPVDVAHAMFGLQVRRAPLEMEAEIAGHAIAIVGMHAVEPLIGIAGDLALAQAELRLPPRREEDLVSSQIPVPQAVVGALRGERVPLLALAHRPLHPLALGDVEQHADHRAAPVEHRARR